MVQFRTCPDQGRQDRQFLTDPLSWRSQILPAAVSRISVPEIRSEQGRDDFGDVVVGTAGRVRRRVEGFDTSQVSERGGWLDRLAAGWAVDQHLGATNAGPPARRPCQDGSLVGRAGSHEYPIHGCDLERESRWPVNGRTIGKRGRSKPSARGSRSVTGRERRNTLFSQGTPHHPAFICPSRRGERADRARQLSADER